MSYICHHDIFCQIFFIPAFPLITLLATSMLPPCYRHAIMHSTATSQDLLIIAAAVCFIPPLVHVFKTSALRRSASRRRSSSPSRLLVMLSILRSFLAEA
mmetsp:Transcript_17674/g.29483  ORF Transcript_17674/g.29483 Transcript_17674/m.29483 type:complete len:100 (-) Transcript_17674:571-870(-)